MRWGRAVLRGSIPNPSGEREAAWYRTSFLPFVFSSEVEKHGANRLSASLTRIT